MMYLLALMMLILVLFTIYMIYKAIFPNPMHIRFENLLMNYGIEVPKIEINCPAKYSHDFLREFTKILNCNLYRGIIKLAFAELKWRGYILHFYIVSSGTTCIDNPKLNAFGQVEFPIIINIKSFELDHYTYPIMDHGDLKYAFLLIPPGETVGHEFSHLHATFLYLYKKYQNNHVTFHQLMDAWIQTGQDLFHTKFRQFSKLIQIELNQAIGLEVVDLPAYNDLIARIKSNVPELLKRLIPNRYYSIRKFPRLWRGAIGEIIGSDDRFELRKLIKMLKKEALKIGKKEVSKIKKI